MITDYIFLMKHPYNYFCLKWDQILIIGEDLKNMKRKATLTLPLLYITKLI